MVRYFNQILHILTDYAEPNGPLTQRPCGAKDRGCSSIEHGASRVRVTHTPAHLDWNQWIGPAIKCDYNSAYHPRKWRSFWDYAFSAGSALATLLFGVAVGNAMVGIPIKEMNGHIEACLQVCRSNRVVYF